MAEGVNNPYMKWHIGESFRWVFGSSQSLPGLGHMKDQMRGYDTPVNISILNIQVRGPGRYIMFTNLRT